MEEHLKDIQQIRAIMERSGRFLSLSGASGILAGTYAIAGAFAFSVIRKVPVFDITGEYYIALDYRHGLWLAFLIGFAVLLLSIGTGLLMSLRKARKTGVRWWTVPARMLVMNLAVPLLTGGIFSMLLIGTRADMLIPGTTLVFYGLALFAGSRYTFSDIRYLGFSEILLGLLAIAFPGTGFLAWIIGFGLFHILYGFLMYFRHERNAAS